MCVDVYQVEYCDILWLKGCTQLFGANCNTAQVQLYGMPSSTRNIVGEQDICVLPVKCLL